MAELLITSPFSVADATAAGFSIAQVRRLLAGGHVRAVVRGVYVSVDVPDSVGLRAAALKRIVPPRAVACRRTAAWLIGVDVLPFGAHLQVPCPELLVPAGTAATRRDGVVGFSAQLADDEVVEIDGVLATAPCRTTLDLGRWLPLMDGVAGVDAMLHADVVTIDELMAGLARLRGYRHKLRLQRVLDLADGRAESLQESRLRVRLVVYAELPQPDVQHVVPVGTGEFRLDMAYVKAKIAVEYDGVENHSSDSDVVYDKWRRELLTRRGWTFHVARSEDVLNGWMAFTAAVRASLRAAGWTDAA